MKSTQIFPGEHRTCLLIRMLCVENAECPEAVTNGIRGELEDPLITRPLTEHTQGGAPLWGEKEGETWILKHSIMSLFPENCFFLTELLFQKRALVDETVLFTLLHKWFVILRLGAPNGGKTYTARNTQFKRRGRERPSSCFSLSFFFFLPAPFSSTKSPKNFKNRMCAHNNSTLNRLS